MKNRVVVNHNIVGDVVEVRFNGSLIKTYPAIEVMDVFGMDLIMRDVEEFADSQNIDLGDGVEIAYVNT